MNYEFALILSKITGSFLGRINDVETEYENGDEALRQITEKCQVDAIYMRNGKLIVEMTQDTTVLNDMRETWAREYEEECGEEPSFF